LLFFLQPIVRGWARYQGRLSYRPSPVDAHERLDSMALKDRGESLDEVYYWADRWVDRIAFLKHILTRLDDGSWQNRADSGWSDFDVEIFGSRWSTLQLTTATEVHAGGKQLFRCRLKTLWSLPAKVTFWSTLAFALLIIGFVGSTIAWLWFLLLVLPLLGWFFSQEERNLQSLIVVFLDDVAKFHGMVKINPPETDQATGSKPAGNAPLRIDLAQAAKQEVKPGP
jgi:hypothetical protein